MSYIYNYTTPTRRTQTSKLFNRKNNDRIRLCLPRHKRVGFCVCVWVFVLSAAALPYYLIRKSQFRHSDARKFRPTRLMDLAHNLACGTWWPRLSAQASNANGGPRAQVESTRIKRHKCSNEEFCQGIKANKLLLSLTRASFERDGPSVAQFG